MLAKQTRTLTILLAALMAGCTVPSTLLQDSAKDVHLRMDNQFDAQECQWLGEVTGSEGHWYSYLFYPNDVMVQGAINDIKNRAKHIGANSVYMVHPQDFATSFTVFGNAYICPENSN